MVAATARKTRVPPNTRLAIGNFIADILVDQREPAVLCHWIVQRVGSAEILYWGQESTFAQAEEAATDYLRSLDEKERKEA